jgi:hypothetical protein
VVITIYLTSSIIGKDSKCDVQVRNEPAFKSYAANCTALGVDVLPKSTAGGNSTNQSIDSTSSASHASAVAAMLFAIILN